MDFVHSDSVERLLEHIRDLEQFFGANYFTCPVKYRKIVSIRTNLASRQAWREQDQE